jgi:hypothetical protein
MTAIVTPNVAKAITEKVATLTQGIRGSIDYHERQLAQEREKLNKVEAQVIESVALAERLRAAGFTVRESSWDNDLTVETEQGSLTAVYRMVGRLELTDKEVEYPRRRTVRVTLRAVNFPAVRVTYVTKLPQNAKCRIERKTTRSRSTYHRLVCDR